MTEKLYVLGHPVAHSKSPAMHNAAYRALGLDWDYGLADCPTDSDARTFLAHAAWLALNVTMPYKPLAFEAASWRSPAAQAAQGANVLVRRGGELLADNTDGRGCVAYLKRCGVPFAGARVVVCGTGPTSLAILHACADAGASRVDLLGRDAARAEAVLADSLVKAGPNVRSAQVAHAGSYASSRAELERATLIVDATPLGMKPGDPAPFDVALLRASQTVFDVVYGQGPSALLTAARAVGCPAFDGAGMLVAQAVETVRDLVDWLSLDLAFDEDALFEIMSQAAFS